MKTPVMERAVKKSKKEKNLEATRQQLDTSEDVESTQSILEAFHRRGKYKPTEGDLENIRAMDKKDKEEEALGRKRTSHLPGQHPWLDKMV